MPPIGGLTGLDWLNQNSLRAFPLADTATRRDVTGGQEMPDELIVDLTLPVAYRAGYDAAGFHVQELTVFGNGLVIKIGYGGIWGSGTWATEPELVAQVMVPATHVPYSSYFIAGAGAFSDTVGRVTIGHVEKTLKMAGLAMLFDVDGGRIVPTCIRPDIRGVSSLRVRNGSDTSARITGAVILTAGSNFRLRYSAPDEIVLDAIDGAGLDEDCDCADTADRPLPPPIRTINGISPGVGGVFTLQSERCISITPATNGLVLEDICSTPCCDSEDLRKLQEDQARFSREIQLSASTLQQLENRVQQLETMRAAIDAAGFLGNE
jgi:hypothetical protein